MLASILHPQPTLIQSQNTVTNWWNGSEYSNNSLTQYKLATEVLNKYSFKGSEKILDIGCGDGKITSLIAREKSPLGYVIGLDASKSMIETAVAYNEQPNATFQEGFAESFQIDDPFDVIVSFSTLHWVLNQQAVWLNIRKHLKIGGHALISLNPLPRDPHFSSALDAAMKNSQFSPFFQNFVERSIMPLMSIKEYEKVILDAGLKVNECSESFKYLEYESKQDFCNSLKAWLPHLAKVPTQLQNCFIDSIISKYLIETNQTEAARPTLGYTNFIIQAIRLN